MNQARARLVRLVGRLETRLVGRLETRLYGRLLDRLGVRLGDRLAKSLYWRRSSATNTTKESNT